MPDVDKIIAFEDGMMDEDEIVEFFQSLIDSGMDWTSVETQFAKLEQ